MRIAYVGQMADVSTEMTFEDAIIGAVILFGVIADELVKRYAAKRRVRAFAGE